MRAPLGSGNPQEQYGLMAPAAGQAMFQQQAAPAVAPQAQEPGVMEQAKDMFLDQAIGKGIEMATQSSLGTALGTMGSAFGPVGAIAGNVAGKFLPGIIKSFFNEGGFVGPLGATYAAEGTSPKPYAGLFPKPTSPYSGVAWNERSSPSLGLQRIIDQAPKANVVTPNAASIVPKFMGPLGTIAGIVNPTMTADATRDPVDTPPMGQEAEMFKRQAALNEAKKRARQEKFMEESGFEGATEALQEAYEAGMEAAKEGMRNIGRQVMPKVIDKTGNLLDLLAPLAPQKEKKTTTPMPMVYEI